MKKRLKRILSVLISVIMIAGLLPAWTVSAGGTGVQEKINQIKAVYPSGSYFTASGSACYDNGGEDCRLGNIPSRGGLPSGSYVAGIVGEAWSCYGFARYCFYYIFGKNFTSSPTVSSPSIGDCISLNNGAHHAIYLREDSQYYYVFDSNGVSVGGSAETGWITDNRVMYEHAMRKSSWSITTIYHASNYDSVNGSSSYNYTSITPDVYYLKNVATGKYLSVDGCVDANKTNISVASWENSSGMKYSVTAASDGYSMRPLCSSSRLVNAWGTAPSSGANVNLYDNCSESSQWWKFEPVNGGYIIHSSYDSSCVLDTDGSNVLITTRHGGTSQIWVLQTQAEAEAENVVPSKPILYCEAIGTSIHAWWDACVNTDRYAIYLHNAETSEIVNKELTITGTEFTFTDVQPGQYFLALASCNNNGYTFGVAKNATVTDISSMDNLEPVDTAVFNGSVYELYNFTTDWETVRQWCELQGGHLVTVTSAEEEAVVEELTQSASSHCWLGASDAENEGEWKWVTGEEFSYSDWYDGEPNNSCGNENYLVINCGVSVWNDTLCNSPYATHFILERNISYPDFTTTLLSNNTISITKYTGSASSLEIPEKIDGLPVTAIDSNAFSGCTSLTSVTILEGVTSIGDSAFYGCTSLASVTIPEGLMSIGSSAFSGCTSLESVTIPSSVTWIGYYAFENCTSLTNITIPESLTSVGVQTFRNCKSIVSMTIPEGVTSIGHAAFSGCTSLESVTIPESVTSIGDSAFYDCTSLASISLPEGVTSIGDSVFEKCTSLASVSIPKGVTSIGQDAFNECVRLTSVTIPESVTNIDQTAFCNCTSLESVTIPDSVTSIDKSAFIRCKRLAGINVDINNEYYSSEDGVLFNKDKTLLIQCPIGNARTCFIIPEGVSSIGDCAFMNCSNLDSVTIPDSVTSIGGRAFEECRSLASVTIPSSVTSIGDDAFFGCDNLVIYGYSGTAAKKYAESNGNVFVSIDTVELTGISINSMPSKATYYIGDSLDTSGLTLMLTYSDDSTETVSSGFTTSGFSSETAGTKTVTVSYGGKTTSFTVTVNEPEPDIDENAPQIVLESKKVTKGKEFTVTVTIKNNPGFTYLEVTPTYSSELTLVGVENGKLINDLSKGKQYIWVADNDVTDDGILMTFTFTTADSIEPGNYEVGFLVRSCVNYDEQNVDISVVNGEIEIVNYKYGDANGDGAINGQDVVRIKKYLANYDYDTETSTIEINAGADANGDGVINGQDVVRIKKYLANYDYDTGTSTIVLGPQN